MSTCEIGTYRDVLVGEEEFHYQTKVNARMIEISDWISKVPASLPFKWHI